jgi:protein-tyrosine kinase
MTDQSKIPLPASGPSLIERASGAFDFRTMTRPVVPDLPPAPVPRVAPLQSAPQPAPQPAAQPAPVPAPAPEVRPFTGPHHAIDRNHLREQCLIEPESGVTGLLEEFRIVKRQLLRTAADERVLNGERILIASAHPGEGKTFCAVNLALSMAAEKDTEVLLVDADFAKPSVLSTLGLPGGPGLMDALADPEIAVEDCVIGTDIAGLYVLPAGNATGSDTEYLASARTEDVLARLTAHSPNRVVIFDSPPVLAASPASVLAHHVGQTVMIVRADVTGEAALRDAVSLLGACDDIKLLLNGTRFSTTGRRFGTYYGYRE